MSNMAKAITQDPMQMTPDGQGQKPFSELALVHLCFADDQRIQLPDGPHPSTWPVGVPLPRIGEVVYLTRRSAWGCSWWSMNSFLQWVHRNSRLGMFATSQGRLHAKTVVMDRRRIFIGSMNFDPRSQKTNTEMGIFIDSPQLAREVLRLMDLDKLQASYRLMLAPDGQGLRWLAADDEGEVSFDTEPDVSFATKFWLELLAPLAPEELL